MIAFIGSRIGQGYQIYIMADDGMGIRCLTEAFPSRGTVFFNLIWSPDGSTLASTLKEHSLSPYTRVCTITIDSGEIRYLTPREGSNFALQWLSKGVIVYREETIRPQEVDSYLCTMHGDGSERRRILHYSTYRGNTYTQDSYHSVAVSPDGSKIAMVSWRDHQLYFVYEGSTPFRIENEGMKVRSLAWALDSSRLAFAAIKSQSMIYEHLWVTRDDGMNKKRLGRILLESGFVWSPNNQHVATIGTHKHILTIDIINTQTSKLRTITTVETDPESQDLPTCPAWSPDGRSIIYTTFADRFARIYRADIATGQTKLVVGDEGAFRTIFNFSWD
jgi:Tol biopolymer transport system component